MSDSLKSTEKIRKRYNRFSVVYDIFELPMELSLRKLRRILISKADGNILEVGVGTGKNLKYYPDDANLTGIDFSEGMLSHAMRKNKAGFSLSFMDVQDLQFPSNSFDTIITTFVFCSVPNPVKGLREIKRVLKPNGKLLMMEHVRSNIFPLNYLMDFFNPFFVNVFGYNINRETSKNILSAGFIIKNEEKSFFNILKRYEIN
jgi:ubiquinone/menaquinone biosynthesis C-methylase UbiE